MFGTPERVADWHLYSYEFIDDLNFMPPASELFRGWPLGEDLLTRVGERLCTMGWDGDGVFQVLWLPPFLGVGVQDYGCYCLVVKQDNDGISWIASPAPLPWVESHQWDTHPIYTAFEERAIAEGRQRRSGPLEE
jgi:hypothetical protein